jgi:predicted nucleic acid-binding protein
LRTAIDTNIISAVWSGQPASVLALSLLEDSRKAGGMVICGVVYAELMAHPKATAQFVDGFLRDTNIDLEFNLDEVSWRRAAERFGEYAQRQRESGGGGVKRLLADFLVAAHAERNADRLITLDRERYALPFPHLRIEPSST